MLGGLLSAAFKGAGEGYSTYAKGEMENQQKLDYAKQLLDMQEEKDLRADAIRRDRNVADIGRITQATANANLAAAPTVGQTNVAQEAAALAATKTSNLPQLRAENEVAGATAKIDAATNAGLPGKEGAYKLAQVQANAPAEIASAETRGKAEGAGTVATVATPGYTSAIEKKSLAESAGQRSVANISAAPHWAALSKPTVQQDSDGNFYSIGWDPKTKSTTTAPITGTDGKPLKGARDLDAKTKLMADAMLADLKTDLDPDSRKQTINNVLDLLRGGGNNASRETQAQTEAQQLVATGKISVDDANKRLIGAGFKPIAVPGNNTSSAPAASTNAPAPKSAAASFVEDPDSPAARSKAKQQQLKDQNAQWNQVQAEKAAKAFNDLDLSDSQAAQQLQDSGLFSYLSSQQKAAVQKAVFGRK